MQAFLFCSFVIIFFGHRLLNLFFFFLFWIDEAFMAKDAGEKVVQH